MRKLIFILFIAIFAVACEKDNTKPESPKEDITYYNISVEGPWTCVDLDANLMGTGTEIDKEINEKLNMYKPDLNMGFIISVCDFVIGDPITHVERFNFEILKKGNIIFTINDDVKLRATGYIQDYKLHLVFLYIDFNILSSAFVLGANYPYNEAMTSDIKGGNVTLIFSPISPPLN